MALKEDILKLLSENNGSYISGEHIAGLYNVSRNAVWKSVNMLRKKGYKIYAVQNKGYILDNQYIFSAETISALLEYPLNIKYFNQVTSTNELAMEYGKNGEQEGLVIAAGSQTSGRGRKNRYFYSPSETGLYFSILLRPSIHFSKALFITTAAAVAVCSAFEQLYNIKAEIKWVNDVFINGKKVCGILTEAHINMETGSIDYAVLGIGVNLFEPYDKFPENIASSAGTVFHNKELSDKIKTEICAKIINNFWIYYHQLEDALFLQEYIDRNLVTGKNIYIEHNGRKEKAHVLGIDNSFRLQVKYENGQTDTIDSGEVSIIL